MKDSRIDRLFNIDNNLLLFLLLLLFLYPLYFTVIASFSEPFDVAMGNVIFWPKGFTLDAYRNSFMEGSIWLGYATTIFNTVSGTLLNLFLTLPTAYVLSKKTLKGRSLLSVYFLFTMYFSGGLIPTYLLVNQLNLLNKPYTLILLGGLSVYNMVVARIYYQTSIPEEIYAAARVDGCSNFGQFFLIALPLSAPIIAVMTLFYAVGRWNDFFNALIYISDSRLYPLQLVLRNILIQSQMALAGLTPGATDEEVLALTRRAYLAEAMKYALIFISSAPLLAAYPFVQKHFVKGMMIGSLKG